MTTTGTQPREREAPAVATVGSGSPQGIELRHLRYFVAVADAGTFTRAADRMYVAQATLSQQIRRLEEMVGASLLDRRREGVRLTAAGAVLLEESRALLTLADHGVNRARQAAGLGRAWLRVVLPPCLPEAIAVEVASRLQTVAAMADVEVVWQEANLDAEFSLIRDRRGDAGVGWLCSGPDDLAEPLEVMELADFEPVAWIPAAHAAADRGKVSLNELAAMDVVHGPRRSDPAAYDAWTALFCSVEPHFEFVDPPFRHRLPVTLAFASTARRPTAVLTGPLHLVGSALSGADMERAEVPPGVVPVRIDGHPLTATAALAWNGDLPRVLQQVLFDTADGCRSGPRAEGRLMPTGPGCVSLVPCAEPGVGAPPARSARAEYGS